MTLPAQVLQKENRAKGFSDLLLFAQGRYAAGSERLFPQPGTEVQVGWVRSSLQVQVSTVFGGSSEIHGR